jgi:hypothetical protein
MSDRNAGADKPTGTTPQAGAPVSSNACGARHGLKRSRSGGRAADADFCRAWDSLQAFRKDYALWRDLGYLW